MFAAPVSTKLSKATNSLLPHHGIIRCPSKSAGNSFPLARTQNTSIANCLIRANQCQMIAATNQRGINSNVQEWCVL